MRKTAALLLALVLIFSALSASAGKELPPVYTWEDVRAQLDKGAATVQIPNDMTIPEGETIEADGTLTIEGGGCTLTGGLTVAGGTVLFRDVALAGTNGVDFENGGAALTVKDGAVAVLSGRSSATGGRAGQFGQEGGLPRRGRLPARRAGRGRGADSFHRRRAGCAGACGLWRGRKLG